MAIKHAYNLSGPNYAAKSNYPSTASETYNVGEALYVSSGAVTKASGTTAPTHISMAYYVAPASANENIAVQPILPEAVFLADKNGDNFSSIVPGKKLTLSTDGLHVTATTTDGVFTVEEVLENEVRGRFI